MIELKHHHMNDLFNTSRTLVLVDGQFGSTGKGLLASKIASMHHRDAVYTNAGPNSGHTFYHEGEKHILMQLPTFAVKRALMGVFSVAVLTHGAVIDPERLLIEAEKYKHTPLTIMVSAYAAVATPLEEVDMKTSIGSTGKGTGSGIANKVMRRSNATFEAWYEGQDHVFKQAGIKMYTRTPHDPMLRNFMEVSQGYSLGLNAGFYPYCTSRDCTVAQAMSDADFHPEHYGSSVMSVRTYPIRVGGNSGPGYDDQRELSWEELGVEPETTTVTGKIRRVFTWSETQFRQAVLSNRPETVFLNFANYLKSEGDINSFIYQNIVVPYKQIMTRPPRAVLIGMGPTDEEVFLWDEVPF